MAGPRFSTGVLDGAIARQRNEREQLRTTTRARLVQALEAAPVRIDTAVIFGSIERPGHFDAASDIDIAVGPLAARDYFTLESHLEGAIEELFELVAAAFKLVVEDARAARGMLTTEVRAFIAAVAPPDES